MPRFKRIVFDNGFVLWDGGSKKECDEFWASGKGGPPISSPSLSLSTKLIRSEERENPRGKGDTGVAGLLESD
jgi:hypothetical protein